MQTHYLRYAMIVEVTLLHGRFEKPTETYLSTFAQLFFKQPVFWYLL